MLKLFTVFLQILFPHSFLQLPGIFFDSKSTLISILGHLEDYFQKNIGFLSTKG